MKKVLILILILWITSVSFAQKKTIIAILPFKSDYLFNSSDQNAIADMVSLVFANSGRFNIFDNDRLRQIIAEKALQNSQIDESNANSFLELGKSLGIEYFIAGNIKNIATKTTLDLTNSTAYTAQISFSLKIINVSTGEIGKVKDFDSFSSIGGIVSLSYDTEQNAILKTIQLMKKSVSNFMEDNFPVTFALMNILSEKNGEAVTVEIMGGKSLGLSKNIKLKVISITQREFNGKLIEKRKEIGTIKITEVQGDEISEAKVVAGGKEILNLFKENPSSIICMTD